MGSQRHSKESIIQTLQNVAARLGKSTLSKREVQPHLPLSSISYHFGNLGTAPNAAGLKVAVQDPAAVSERFRVDDNDLFASLWEIEKKIGYPPNLSQYRANGGSFSDVPFRRRLGRWASTLQHYHKWKVDRGEVHTNPSNVADPSKVGDGATLSERRIEPLVQFGGQIRRPPQLYGEPIDFRGLRHAPINEQGVVYLFGMVSRELGFSVEALQQGFPDCEGKYLHDKSRQLWAKARIEFEFLASHFRVHGHNADECDIIVCWENDWEDCPLRVVELKKEIMRLPAR